MATLISGMSATAPKGAQLGTLTGLAGGALSAAQGELGLGADLSSTMVLSEAALEIKAAIGQTKSGELLVEPLSSAHLAARLEAAAISTLRLSFVATASEMGAQLPAPPSGGGTGAAPGLARLTREQALAIFGAQEDVQRLEKLLGPFELRTHAVALTGQWIVQATDPAGRVVREQLIRQLG
jgi:hypothetical protein